MNSNTAMHPFNETDSAPAAPTPRKGNLRPILIGAGIALAAGIAAWQYWSDQDDAALTTPPAERASTLLSGTMPAVPTGMPPVPTDAKAPQVAGLDVMAQRLAKRLEKDAGDGEGWSLLARTYLELGNLTQAEAAQAQALRLRPNDMRMKADYDSAKAILLKEAGTSSSR